MSGKPSELMEITMDGGVGERVLYELSCPSTYYEYYKKKTGKNPLEAFHLDNGVRSIGPKILGKPPWDQPWGDPPDNPVQEEALKSRFRKYLPKSAVELKGARITEWGCLTVPGSLYHLRRLIYPMADMLEPSEIDKYPFPDYTEEWRWADLAKVAKEYIDKGYYVVGTIGSIFETTWFMRGQEQLLIDLYENPDFAARLLDEVTVWREYIAHRIAKMGVQCILVGDDMGIQNSLIMKLPMLKSWILSRWEKVIDAAKLINPKIKVNFHTDGKNQEAIPDLISIGITCINPVQPECDDPELLKKLYGKRLTLMGTLSSRTLTFGSAEEIREEVKLRMQTAKNYGGLILTNNNTPDRNTPWESFDAFYEAAEEYCHT